SAAQASRPAASLRFRGAVAEESARASPALSPPPASAQASWPAPGAHSDWNAEARLRATPHRARAPRSTRRRRATRRGQQHSSPSRILSRSRTPKSEVKMQKSKREVVRPFCVLPFEFLLSLYLLC